MAGAPENFYKYLDLSNGYNKPDLSYDIVDSASVLASPYGVVLTLVGGAEVFAWGANSLIALRSAAIHNSVEPLQSIQQSNELLMHGSVSLALGAGTLALGRQAVRRLFSVSGPSQRLEDQ